MKNPSVFIKKMEFIRDYEIRDGVAYLKRMESHTDTRIVGRADLNIEYANVQASRSKAVDSRRRQSKKLAQRFAQRRTSTDS